MVRLERNLYEMLVNSSILGRARKLDRPSKWFTKKNQSPDFQLHYWPFGNIVYKAILPLIEKIAAKEYQITHEVAKEQGIPTQTFMTMHETEWRRDIDLEHIKRENIHPWNILETNIMRCRYWKVQKYLEGYTTPEYLLEKSHDKGVVEDDDVMQVYRSLKQVYEEDKTPTLYMFRSLWVPLDALILHNSINEKNYNRYFFNEADYTEEISEVRHKRLEAQRERDYSDPKVQNEFKNWMEEKIKEFPGLFVREGQQFNYDSFFRKMSVLNGNNNAQENMSQQEVEQLRNELNAKRDNDGLFANAESGSLNLNNNEEILERKNTVGINMPKEIAGQKYKAWMA